MKLDNPRDSPNEVQAPPKALISGLRQAGRNYGLAAGERGKTDMELFDKIEIRHQ
jgi:hypothetical protein